MTQYGFFIDQTRCIGCNSCSVACLQWNDIQPGNIRWMRVQTWEEGAFPNIRQNILPINCYHCQDPFCVKACKHQAISKEPKYGAVLVDQDKCCGDRNCFKACPYGAPQFADDEPGQKMSKCHMCIDRLEQGQLPICVRSCSMRALEFGPLAELMAKFGEGKPVPGLPSSPQIKPSAVIRPKLAKKQVVKYNAEKALRLWQVRSPYGPEQLIFEDPKEVTQAPSEIIGRNKLVLKAKTAKEKQYYATDDD